VAGHDRLEERDESRGPRPVRRRISAASVSTVWPTPCPFPDCPGCQGGRRFARAREAGEGGRRHGVRMLATGFAGSPPAAPLAETAPGEPSGGRIPLFKWEPNKQLCYDQECFAETTAGGKRSTESTRGSDVMTGLERYHARSRRVRLVNDGTELGFLFFDEEGRTGDVTVTLTQRDGDVAVLRRALSQLQ
jgi:hypothetical protein